MSQTAAEQAPRARQSSSLLGSWVSVFVGFTAARVLGFLFSVAATRLLPKAEFGELAYALTIAGLTSVFLSSSPVGMSRYLVLHHEDPTEQDSYYTNWVFVCTLLLMGSLLATPVIGAASGLSVALTVGVAAQLVGVWALETNREAQRGADQYFEMAVMYVIANLLQLLVVIALGVAGIRSASVYLLVYGFAPLIVLVPMQLARPVGFHFRLRLLSRARLMQIFRFCIPLLLQSIGFAVWFGADVVLLRNIADAETTGAYGAAKTMATVVAMPATALAMVLLPRAARFNNIDFRSYLVMAGVVTAAATLPFALAVSVLGRVLVLFVFGARYEDAATALVSVPFAMAFWGIYQVMANLWVGRGKPGVDLGCTIVAVAGTLIAGGILVPVWGMTGAAVAFTIGSAVRLVAVVAYSARAFRTPAYAEAAHQAASDTVARPLLFIGGDAPFMQQVVDAARAIVPVGTVSNRVSDEAASLPARVMGGVRSMLAATQEIRRLQPCAIVLGSQTGVTLSALLRARALRLVAMPTPVVMLVPEGGTNAAPPPRWWGRWLFPELLLVGLETDVSELGHRGARVDFIWGAEGHRPTDTASEEHEPPWDMVAQRLVTLTQAL